MSKRQANNLVYTLQLTQSEVKDLMRALQIARDRPINWNDPNRVKFDQSIGALYVRSAELLDHGIFRHTAIREKVQRAWKYCTSWLIR